MRVKDVMSTRLHTCEPTTPVQEVARIMREGDCGALPVCDPHAGSRVVGIVTDRDITVRLVAANRNPLNSVAADCMSSPVVSASVDETLTNCCRIMEQHKVRRLPIVDNSGKCVGIISQADIARHAPEARTGDLLQEISQPAA